MEMLELIDWLTKNDARIKEESKAAGKRLFSEEDLSGLAPIESIYELLPLEMVDELKEFAEEV